MDRFIVAKPLKRGAWLLVGAVLALTALPSGVVQAEAGRHQREQLFAEAAAEFGVPKEVLLAISYNQSRWENHQGRASASGGYGLMHLTARIEAEDGRGDPVRPLRTRATASQSLTLDEAAALLQASPKALKQDDRTNIRGGAALLARYAREANNGRLPTQLSDWYTAAARLGNAADNESAREFADAVYGTIQGGAERTTTDGEAVTLTPQKTEPDRSKLHTLRLRSRDSRPGQTECPATIICKFVPARFAQNNPSDPTDYGNYDQAHRPADMKIKYIVIHDTEGSYQSSIDWFQNPASYVAAHYLIRSSDGEVTQMVKNEDVAWHAGNWYMNMHSIGVEHEGFASEGATWYTETMYRTSAKLVRYLADKYHVPLDRQHIVGHEQYHRATPGTVATMHTDPGPYWDWEHYMELLQAPSFSAFGTDSKVVRIAPRFATNQPPVTTCQDGTCTPLPAQPTNFIYLRTAPSSDAALLTDAGMHPDGAPGTTEITDWGAKAFQGQQFAVAERQGDWTAIWFSGQKGWFFNPTGQGQTAQPTFSRRIAPKDGASSVPVYGRPLPEASAFEATGAPVRTVVPLQYTILAGQAYTAYERDTPNDYFHVLSFDRSTPGDGTITIGSEKYIPISYNHRQAYVKAADVKFLP
jgi:N-acetyl-anhydromuramyl-L-alanine amidase AmpD